MVYFETKKNGTEEYLYFVKKISILGKNYKIKEYIGKPLIDFTPEDFLIKNINKISNKEFDIRKIFLENINFGYNKKLPFELELNSIILNNYNLNSYYNNFLFDKFSKIFTYNSNSIEGSRIDSKAVEEIIDTGSTKYNNFNEILEVKNTIKAFKYLKKDFNFNIASIKKLYSILTKDLKMKNGEPYPKGFKKIANTINNTSTISPEDVEKHLNNLLKWYKENKNKIHPLILAFKFHLEYEHIHPFLDGNGRTGRLIMNKILMNNNYFPIIIFNSNSENYSNSIKKALENDKIVNYYQFMLEQSRKSYSYFLEEIKK